MRLKRVIRDKEVQLTTAVSTADNARRVMNQQVGAAITKVNACSAVAKFLLPRLSKMDVLLETRNPCVVCHQRSNVQLGLITGCQHKFCYDCIVTLIDFSNGVNNGCCPMCRNPISSIEDAEYSPHEGSVERDDVVQQL